MTSKAFGLAQLGNAYADGALSNRNKIINGAMVIDQRNAGAAVTVNSTAQTFSVDRWWASGQSTDGVFTMQQSSTAPSGFSNSTLITVTTADASIGTTQRYYFAQRIEGFNTADLGWGTASASTVTLSFWVRSSVTGAFGGFVYNSDADYSYPFSYTISSANTWEQKAVTIAGPTAGTWVGATNGMGLQVGWSLGAGTDRLGTAGAWTAAQKFGATGQTNLIATLNATFYITGVQLEAGDTATPFEHRSYGAELALCQRYYFRFNPSAGNSNTLGVGFVDSSTSSSHTHYFPVPMRAAPSALEQSGTAGNYAVRRGGGASTTCSAVPAFSDANITNATFRLAVSSGLTAGQAVSGRAVNTNAYLAWSAEL